MMIRTDPREKCRKVTDDTLQKGTPTDFFLYDQNLQITGNSRFAGKNNVVTCRDMGLLGCCVGGRGGTADGLQR